MPDPVRTARSRSETGLVVRCGRAATTAALVVAMWVLASGTAGAHASLVVAQPEPGSDLAAAPAVVLLRFSEPLIADLSSVVVTDPLGQTFRAGPSDPTTMEVDLGSTALGTYTVEWKTVSPIDGHTLTGRYDFGVGADVGAQADPSDGPSAADLVVAGARTLEYLGLLGAAGLVTLAAVAHWSGVGWRPAGLHRWLAAALAGGLATVTGEILLATSGSVVAGAAGFLSAATGRLRLVRVGVEVVAVLVATMAVRRADSGRVEHRPARVALFLLVLGALAAVAAAGHAAASSYGVTVAAGHLWTAALWAGTVLAMALHRPPGGWRGEDGRRVASEFTPLALSVFTATAVLGVVRGWQELGHPADLWTTAYGQVLWAKVAVVGVMAGLSRSAWRRARQHAGGEGVAATVVVLLAAVLVAFPVPPGRVGDDPVVDDAGDTDGLPRPGDLTLATTVGRTVVGVSLRSGEPGINDVFVHLVPAGREPAADIDVTVSVDGGPAVPTRRCGPGCRVATTPLAAGDTLAFELAGPEHATGRATITVPPLPAPDGTSLLRAAEARMDGLNAVRYDESFGPASPPITSSWTLVLPDRIHGTIDAPNFRETIRIDDAWWYRSGPDEPWVERGGNGLSVRVDQFLWELDRSNIHLAGTGTVGGVDTTVVAFFGRIGDLPVWVRLWIDADDLVRRAVMLTRGHFMDQHYRDHDEAISIEPPE